MRSPQIEEVLDRLGALLRARGRWPRTQDDSKPFLGELRDALALFGVEVDDGDL